MNEQGKYRIEITFQNKNRTSKVFEGALGFALLDRAIEVTVTEMWGDVLHEVSYIYPYEVIDEIKVSEPAFKTDPKPTE